jgi:methylated-DNA-[protein]-cysteine S-methyltransferase
MKLYTQRFDTPYGLMLIAVDDSGKLNRLVFPNEHARWAAEIVAKQFQIADDLARTESLCAPILAQLAEYFAGERRVFDLVLAPHGTPFQLSVWEMLKTIPYGKTITYAHLAELIGNPAARRAVGHANGANPIPIIIPCHRVIGANGQLTGFGGGLPLKAALLTLEGVLAPLQTKLAF